MKVKETITRRLSIRRYAETSTPTDHMQTLFTVLQSVRDSKADGIMIKLNMFTARFSAAAGFALAENSEISNFSFSV